MGEAVLINVAGLLACGASLLVAARLVGHSRTTPSPLDFLMTVVAWSCIAAALTTTALIVLSAIGGILLWMVTFVVLAVLWNRTTLARQDFLLSVLATCVRKGMPLEPVLDGLAREYRGLSRRRVLRLVAMLRQGVSLPEALRRARRLVPRQAVVAARVGLESGQLAAALEDVAAQRSRRAALWNPLAGRGALLVWTLTMMFAIGTFWLGWIAPKLNAIQQDFGIQLPAPWPELFSLFDGSPFTEVFVIVQVACLLGFFYLMLVYIGWLPFALPVGPLQRPFEAAPLLRNLALVADARQPFVRGVTVLAEAHPRYWIRGRLRRAAALLSAGAPLSEALDRARLINAASASLIKAAERSGNLPWALRTIADSAERSLAYRLQAASQIVIPLLVVVLGLLVALFALGCFLPLIWFIKELLP